MRTKLLRTATLLAGFLWLAIAAAAQERSVQGTVFDGDGKSPLVGVTVIVKGAPNRGTVTGADGQYSIRAKEGEELTFTYLGYEEVTQRIGGGKTRLDVTMHPKAEAIEGVVVTALGMTREQKALGYAVSKVDNQDLTAAVSNNWLDALSGKVAGLNFDHASSGPGGSLRVTLRGESTVNMDNNTALFVIDGVPMSSGMTAMGGAAYNNTDAGVDYGNGAADLNPEDIDNVSVLKGPAATALYGSRAANGAIVITTKAGKSTKGLGITFSSNFSHLGNLRQGGLLARFPGRIRSGQQRRPHLLVLHREGRPVDHGRSRLAHLQPLHVGTALREAKALPMGFVRPGDQNVYAAGLQAARLVQGLLRDWRNI